MILILNSLNDDFWIGCNSSIVACFGASWSGFRCEENWSCHVVSSRRGHSCRGDWIPRVGRVGYAVRLSSNLLEEFIRKGCHNLIHNIDVHALAYYRTARDHIVHLDCNGLHLSQGRHPCTSMCRSPVREQTHQARDLVYSDRTLHQKWRQVSCHETSRRNGASEGEHILLHKYCLRRGVIEYHQLILYAGVFCERKRDQHVLSITGCCSIRQEHDVDEVAVQGVGCYCVTIAEGELCCTHVVQCKCGFRRNSLPHPICRQNNRAVSREGYLSVVKFDEGKSLRNNGESEDQAECGLDDGLIISSALSFGNGLTQIQVNEILIDIVEVGLCGARCDGQSFQNCGS